MSTSTDIMSATISQNGALPAPPPERGTKGELPDAVPAIEKTGSSLTADVQDSLLAGVVELAESGASSEDISAFVDSALAANGVEDSGGHQRSGQLVDMMS